MSNKFRITAVLKTNMNCKLKLLTRPKHSSKKKSRALHALEDLEPLFKIFCTFVCKKSQKKIQINM